MAHKDMVRSEDEAVRPHDIYACYAHVYDLGLMRFKIINYDSI